MYDDVVVACCDEINVSSVVSGNLDHTVHSFLRWIVFLDQVESMIPYQNSYVGQLSPYGPARITMSPDAKTKMDVAMADMIHRNAMAFNFGRDMKFMKVIPIAQTLPADYTTPDCRAVGGRLLETLYEINWCEGNTMLVADCNLFGIV